MGIKQTPDPKNSNLPPPLVWYSWIRHWQHGVIHKHTKQYGACSSKSNNNNNNNNNNKSALYGQKEKRYSTTQHCTDTKQNNIYLYNSNKNKSALYGHTEKRYSTRHKPLKYNVIQTHTKQCTTRTSRYTDTQTMLNWINLNNTSLNISLNKLPHTSRSVYQTHKNDTVQHGFIQTRTSTIHVCTEQNSVIQTYTRWCSTLQRYSSKKNRVQHIVIQTHTKQYGKKQRYIQTVRHYGGVDRPNKKKFFVRTNL